MTVGQRIAQKRKELGLSQEALGDRLGVSRQSIYKWESDSALPEVEKLIALSKLFGVSVGWLLGVEDAPLENTAPENSGELTETHLKMVEEIVSRYLAAQPKADPQRQRRFFRRGATVFAALFCACFFAIFSLFQRLDRMDQQYNSLQNSVNNVTHSVNSQIGSISNRVEEILKSQNNLTAEYGTELSHTNLRENRAVFSVYAVPKTYVEGMTVKFSVDNGTGGIQNSLGEEGLNQRFSTTLACQLTDSIALSVSFLYPDGTLQTQLLDTYEHLYTDSLPYVDISIDNLMHSKLAEPGLFIIPAPEDSSVRYVLIDPEQKGDTPALSKIRVGLFKNQALVSWAEPCAQPDSFQGFDRYDFYALPDLRLPLAKEDVLCFAAILTDQYGRTTVCPGMSYILDETGEELTWPDEINIDPDPSHWEF